MTAIIPSVKVYETKTPANSRPGIAGKIAVVGAFDTTETNPKLFYTLAEAYTTFGDDKTNYKGCSCLDKLFYGAESVLAVNITTETSATPPVREKELTTAKLTTALSKIKGEDFDILFIADDLTDAGFPIVTAFLDECFGMKFPCGFVAGITRANTSAYVTSAGLAGDHCYGLITQQFKIGGETYSVTDSGAYYAGVLASMNVGSSMTMKEVPQVIGVTPELSFETGGDGKGQLEAGITTVKCQDRNNGRYVVVNSEQPNGWDLYINRTRDYVVKELALHQFLGERNNEVTLSEIKHELARVEDECVGVLDLLEDIEYTVSKKDANCVDINITSLLFAGIITTINVYITVEVQ